MNKKTAQNLAHLIRQKIGQPGPFQVTVEQPEGIVEGFHTYARNQHTFGLLLIESNSTKLWLSVQSWNKEKPDNYYVVVFLDTPQVHNIVEMHRIEDNNLCWTYAPRKKGKEKEKNPERKRRFAELFGNLKIKIPLPDDVNGVDRFLSKMFRLVDCRQRADSLEGNGDSTATTFTYELEGRMVSTTQQGNGPENLILYGPPGTGKTYTTIAEAVRLCDGLTQGDPLLSAPEQRANLMARYRQLVGEDRIEFVTFHQSFAYEDFVEGLRPTIGETSGQIEDERASSGTSGIGFTLKPVPGAFKRICERARLDQGGQQPSSDRLDRNRPVYKISLGEKDRAEGRRLIQEAIDQELIHLGHGGGIDLSDARFDDPEEVRHEWHARNPDAPAYTKVPSMLAIFRSTMQIGDYVLVSDGTRTVQAIGQVAGEYYFDKEKEGGYHHKRKVKWLWNKAEGVPGSTFYDQDFTWRALHGLGGTIDWDALEEVVYGVDASKPAQEARDFVLIIDEINRANVSKVFGELITLLEADKRLGAENEIRVRLPYSGRRFGVPANLHIVGTMNTADRSIALLDTALRRRFAFRELMPKPELLLANVDGINLQALLATVNERIEFLYDREHQVGHAYFMHLATRADIEQVMRDKVIPLLAEYFYEDWAKIAAVLGDADGAGRFLRRARLSPGGSGAGDQVGERYRWTVRDKDDGFDFSEFAANA